MFEPPDSDLDLQVQTEQLRLGTYGEYTMDVAGEMVPVFAPTPQAIHVFKSAVSKYTPRKTQNDLVTLFVQDHTTPEQFERLMVRMIDPTDTFTMPMLGEIMRKIVTFGTARPTKPLQFSH